MLLDFRSEIHVAAVFPEHGRMRHTKAALIGSRGNMEQIHAVLQLPGNGNAVIQRIAALEQLGTAHAEFYGKGGTHGSTHGLKHAPGKTTAILQRTAVLIPAMIEPRRKELIDQPAVPAMNHEHFKPGAFGKPGNAAVGFHNLVDHSDGKLAYFHAVRPDTGGRPPLRQPVLAVLVRHVRAGIHAGMRKLHAGNGPVTPDGVGRVGKGSQRVENGRIQMVGMAAVRLRMHHTFAHRHGRSAATGAQLVKCR